MTEELLQRYLCGISTPAENMEILDKVEADEANRKDLTMLRKIYDVVLCNISSFGPGESESAIDWPDTNI